MKDLATLLCCFLVSASLQPTLAATPMGGTGVEPEKRVPIFYFDFNCPIMPTAEEVPADNYAGCAHLHGAPGDTGGNHKWTKTATTSDAG